MAALTLAATLTLSVSTAQAHVARCDARPSPILCTIHTYRNRVWRLETRLDASPTRYGWTAERKPSSAAYRIWVRHLWYTRWLHWRHLAALRPWPAWWLPEALCIHDHEGAWNDNPWNTSSSYWGGMQFLISTWLAHGGARFSSTRPDLTSPRDQLTVAYNTWRDDGGSWREWGTAAACGLL
jgi:hypothetical protein